MSKRLYHSTASNTTPQDYGRQLFEHLLGRAWPGEAVIREVSQSAGYRGEQVDAIVATVTEQRAALEGRAAVLDSREPVCVGSHYAGDM